jgi:hypothetical protein
MRAFRNPVDGMTFTVAWLIENNLRSRSGIISVTTDTPVPAGDGRYKVTFHVGDKDIDSEWVNEYGIWRIRTFGDFASGDKTMIEKRRKEMAESARLVTEPVLRISAGVAFLADLGPAFGLDLIISGNKYTGLGFQAVFAPSDNKFVQIELVFDVYVPIPMGSVAFIPYGGIGLGLMFKENPPQNDSWTRNSEPPFMARGLSLEGGLLFTTSLVPGLYVQIGYGYNFYEGVGWKNTPRGALITGIGISF